jgi:hypothetical protein
MENRTGTYPIRFGQQFWAILITIPIKIEDMFNAINAEGVGEFINQEAHTANLLNRSFRTELQKKNKVQIRTTNFGVGACMISISKIRLLVHLPKPNGSVRGSRA